MLYLAMSAFQARPQWMAYRDLLELNPDGIQLTPGNIISPEFKDTIKLPYRYHHGFSWDSYRREVYDNVGQPIEIGRNHSIHPPKRDKFDFKSWMNNSGDYLYEVMYPEYLLGNGTEIEIALNLSKRLAIDISHLNILQCQEVISSAVLKRLLNYDRIEEIHISHNSGKFDTHQPINENSPFLSWVRERKSLIIVYESYMHRLSLNERKAQIEIVRNLLK